MPTNQQVPNLHPLQHYESCERDVHGRAVLHLLDGAADDITAVNVRAYVRGFRLTHPCDCLALRLLSVSEQLRVARKAFKACLSDANADRVAELTRQRDALRVLGEDQ